MYYNTKKIKLKENDMSCRLNLTKLSNIKTKDISTCFNLFN